MSFGIQEIMIAAGAVLMTWVFNNVKLREGITDWFVSKLGMNSYKITNHNVKTTLKAIKLEADSMTFDNEIKTELYQYYIDTVIDNMSELVDVVFENEKKTSFEDTKSRITNATYDKLLKINHELERNISMPETLQVKFDKCTNYLNMQQKFNIETSMHAVNKKLLMIQVCDAIENNSRWFLFYVTEMFENFNGAFKGVKRDEVFKR